MRLLCGLLVGSLWLGLLAAPALAQTTVLPPGSLPCCPPLPIGRSPPPAQLPSCPCLPVPFPTGPAPPARETREPSTPAQPPTKENQPPANPVDPVNPPPNAANSPADQSAPSADQTTPSTDQTAAPPADAFAQAPPAGAGAADTYSPNMFGDQFGGSRGASVITIMTPGTTTVKPGVLNGQHAALTFQGATFVPSGSDSNSAGTYFWTSAPSTTSATFTTNPGGTQNLTIPAGASFTQNGPDVVANPNAAPPAPSGSAIAFIKSLLPPGQPLFVAADNAERAANPRATLNQLNAIPGNQVVIQQAGFLPLARGDSIPLFSLGYDLTLQDQITEQVPAQFRPIVVNIPNPAAGGTVGRIQIAEDINPLPRDRVIFDYDFFSHVPLSSGGWDVHRLVFGFEKTFLNDMASIEVRVPVAATLNHDITVGAESSHTELGNVRLLLKVLLFGNDTFNLAGGLGVHLPTAAATRVTLPNNIDLVKIGNETVILSPYLGALWTPTPRLFAQTWLAFDLDPRGNPVYLNTDLTGLKFAGRLNDQTLMQVDGQIGYWLIRNNEPRALLRGVAPFAELHYNSSVGRTDFVSSGGFLIGDLSRNRDQLDATAGLVFQLGDRLNLSLGLVLPLRQGDDRSFDWQVGLRANLLLGRAAQGRDNGSYVP